MKPPAKKEKEITHTFNYLKVTEEQIKETRRKVKFATIITRENQYSLDDARCAICLDGDCYEDDTIVVCSLCNVAVHQKCYNRGLKNKVPDIDWF